MIVATTSETPEVEVELVKGKDKAKETEIINLEDVIDVKGWRAIGNRLSQFKVTKVTLTQDPEEANLEEDQEGEAEVTESENDSQSPKKKEQETQWSEPTEQVNLFGEPAKPKQPSEQSLQSQPKQKVKAEQQNLFGEAESPKQQSQSHQQNQNPNQRQSPRENESEAKEAEEIKQKSESDKQENSGGKAFGVGETIDLDI